MFTTTFSSFIKALSLFVMLVIIAGVLAIRKLLKRYRYCHISILEYMYLMCASNECEKNLIHYHIKKRE